MVQEWKDVTSYRHGGRGNAEPSVWELRGKHVCIRVHRYHGCSDAWFVTCRQAGLETRGLAAPTVEEAKRQAVELVKNKLRMLSDDACSLCYG